jgi:hypothetical protein
VITNLLVWMSGILKKSSLFSAISNSTSDSSLGMPSRHTGKNVAFRNVFTGTTEKATVPIALFDGEICAPGRCTNAIGGTILGSDGLRRGSRWCESKATTAIPM